MATDETIISYKGFDKDLECRGFQYEIGKEYELPNGETVSVCSHGFHACESPLEVLDYYFLDDNANLSRFCEVEQSGEFSKEKFYNSTKIASSKIKIKREITFADLIKLGLEWIKEKTSQEKVDANPKTSLNDEMGDFAQICSSDNDVQIYSSDNGVQIVSSGKYAQIGSSGDCARIGSSGFNVQIVSSGSFAKIVTSSNYAKIGSSGSSAKIASSGDFVRIVSSGDNAKIASSGDNLQIGSSGYNAKISSSGDIAHITSSGNNAKISSSGDNAKISSSGEIARIGSSGDSAMIASLGHYVQIDSTGENSVIMCAGNNSRAKAKKGSWITLVEWYKDNSCGKMRPKCVKTEYVDGEHIKADTWYKLFEGEFVEANK